MHGRGGYNAGNFRATGAVNKGFWMKTRNTRMKTNFPGSTKVNMVLLGLLILLLSALLAACGSGGGSDAAAQVVEDYYRALAEGNVDQMISLSCADWEQNARLEFDAFAGVQTELGDLQCTSSGKDGDVTLVTCTGEILATYGNEQQNFPLGGIDYRVVQEAGEWRMCGF